MRHILSALLLVFTLFLVLPATGQQLNPPAPESSELITPVNASPLSIETVARRRGLLVETPARNLIVFCTSGFAGASASFREAFTSAHRDGIRWQGFQLVFPAWADRQKGIRNSLLSSMSQVGRRLGLVSDSDFRVPGVLDGADNYFAPDLEGFSLAISLSDKTDAAARTELVKAATQNQSTAIDFNGLEKLFTSKSPKIAACLHNDPAAKPGFPELVSAALSRISLAPEGFCTLVNLSAVAENRQKNQFVGMLDAMRVRENVLKQLETFVAGRKDTLLLVLDEPERGYWQVGNTFSPAAFVDALKKLRAIMPELGKTGADVKKLLTENFSDFELPVEEIVTTAQTGNNGKVIDLVEEAVSRRFAITFTPFPAEGTCAGYTILAQGQNADLFFGISSFPEFFRRIELALGLNSSSKK
ncbi:MAG TPA: hypothetical protein PLK28_04570 [Candidatus Rifleibacterium sp.]|nr:hypothetical protein [Candidatus Rifleibacterium sp.]